MKAIHVLHVYKTYFPESQGGVEEAIRQICRSTSSLGVASDIFTLARVPRPPVIETAEAHVRRYKRWCRIASCDISGLTSLRGFERLVREHDLVHYHFPWPFGDLLKCFSRVRKPSIVTYHSDIVRQRMLLLVYRPFMRRFLESVDAIVATSPHYVRTSPVLQEYAHKVSVIPLGLAEDAKTRLRDDLLQRWESDVGRDFFLFIGALRYYKGLQYLIEAVRGTEFKVVIIGDGPEGAKLKKLATGVDNLRFVGHVDDASKYVLLHLARCVLFPSHSRAEAFGIALLEGALFSKPLITTEIGTGTSYVNIDDETGLVVPPANPSALRKAMSRLVAEPELAHRMGRAARKRFETMFTASQLGASYVELYRRLVTAQ